MNSRNNDDFPARRKPPSRRKAGGAAKIFCEDMKKRLALKKKKRASVQFKIFPTPQRPRCSIAFTRLHQPKPTPAPMKRRSFIKKSTFAAAVIATPVLLTGIANAESYNGHSLYCSANGQMRCIQYIHTAKLHCKKPPRGAAPSVWAECNETSEGLDCSHWPECA